MLGSRSAELENSVTNLRNCRRGFRDLFWAPSAQFLRVDPKDASALFDQLLGDWALEYGEVEISLHGPAGAG
jgi:hypothetical protein